MRVVGQEQLADRLLRPVACAWRGRVVVADHVGERPAVHGDRRSEDDAWAVAVVERSDRVEEEPCPVEVDAIALFEVRLRLARDHGREMEDDVRPGCDQTLGDSGLCEVGDERIGLRRLHDIDEVDVRDRLTTECPVACQPLHELASDHARGTGDQDAHSVDSRTTPVPDRVLGAIA